jgi:hypothetical protein
VITDRIRNRTSSKGTFVPRRSPDRRRRRIRVLRVGLVAEHRLGDAPEEGHGADGDGDGGDVELGDEPPVEETRRESHPRPMATMAAVSKPAADAAPMQREDRAMMDPTDTSMSPHRMMNIIGRATTAFSMKLKVVSRRLPVSRKYGI